MSSSLIELWTALNSCLWSCVVQSAAEEVNLDGRTFRVIRLVGAASTFGGMARTCCRSLPARIHQTKQTQL